ncbi:MAG: NnrS family protein [Bdellovibrionales bacterium]|nr:NnrS family protein [Bdellovibrionales bacterium]
MSSNLENPYRPFFFVGTIAAIVGTGAWVANAWIPGAPYPGRFHAHMMMGLFLMSFAMGFLMTALPRMTQTFATRRYEFVFASLSLGLLATVGITDEGGKEFFGCILLNAGFLLFFAARRVLKRKNNLPEIFPLVLWGLISAVAGSVLSLLDFQPLGEKLFYLNFMLCLVLGVGMRLVPMLLRLDARPQKLGSLSFFFIGSLLTISLLAEELWYESWGSYLRAVTVSLVAVFGWRLFARSETNTGLTWGIRAAGFFTVAGTWGMAVFPAYRLEALHVIYVMGFSLMTFMVASRVILAHGNFGIENEARNLFIKIPIFFLILAGLTRVAAIFIPESYAQHLGYAALAFIIGVGVWAKYFLPRVFTNYGQLEK